MHRNKLMVFIMSLILTACAHTIPVKLISNNYINPDNSKRSLPVQVKIYLLSKKTVFLNSNFHDLWQNPKQALGKTLISEKTLIINPENTLKIKFHYVKSAKYIGAIGIFRRPDLAKWRAVEKLPTRVSAIFERITIHLRGYSINLNNKW